jgi:hypothetical protein
MDTALELSDASITFFEARMSALLSIGDDVSQFNYVSSKDRSCIS